jgi:hypothetical protein
MTTSSIQQNVMRRVRTIHALKAASSGAGASAVLLVVSLYIIGREVWVARVWENMPNIGNLAAFSRFFTYAFTHTNLSVQVLILLTVLAAVWFLREFARVLTVTSMRVA